MGKVTPYTESDIAYIKAHFGIDMLAKDIAAHLNRNEHALSKWVSDHREEYGFKNSRLREVGTSFTYYCKSKKCHITRTKNADGTFTIEREKKPRKPYLWTEERKEYVKAHYRVDMTAKQLADHYGVTVVQMCSLIAHMREADPSYVVKKRLAIGDIREDKTKRGQIQRRIKTEAGWKYIKKGYSKDDRKKIGEMNAARLVKPVGTITTRQTSHGPRQFQKQEDGKWRIIGLQGQMGRIKSEKKRLVTSAITRKRAPKNDPQRVKQAIDSSRNPKVVKIMSDADKIAAGYRYVNIDAKTRVLRHPSKLTEEQKTA